jgi:GH18 family chitinase
MLAFTRDTLPLISGSLDFLNIMTYDLMNRRDRLTKHHTGIAASLDAIRAYLEHGGVSSPEKVNLGFAFYVKWFRTDPHADCGGAVQKNPPIGCPTVLMEDPATGRDLGQAGAFSWHDDVPSELERSFMKALANPEYDDDQGAAYFWDCEENIWWSWDTPDVIMRKFPRIVEKMRLGGVFAWGLGEDAPRWTHLQALTAGVEKYLSKQLDDMTPPVKDEL